MAATPPMVDRIYAFILQVCEQRTGVPPTVREICKGVGLGSTNTVQKHLNDLATRGLITRSSTESRGIAVVGATWTPPGGAQ